MKNLIQRIFAALERSAQRRREREIEGYLSQATDAADLENRLRRIERVALRRELLQVAE
ncbi:MAG TPA: DUF3563 family protein [Burkholderiales bacterium]|nr:DUF3563 family protein [Burkholderiales bacterium]